MTSAARITAFAVSAEGDRLATAHDDGTVRVTDVATAAPVLAVEAEARAVALDPDGRLVVTGHEETVVWSTETGAEVARIHAGFPTSTLAFGPGNRLLVTGSESRTAVLHPDGAVTTLPYDGNVFAAAFAGERVVTVSTITIGGETRGDDDLRVWDAGNVVSRIARAEHGVFALGGRLLADAAGAEVVVRDVESGAETHRLDAGATVTELRFSPDAGRLAVVTGERVRAWDLTTSAPGPERDIGDAWIAGVDPAGRYLAVHAGVYSGAWLLDLEDGRRLSADDTSHVDLDRRGALRRAGRRPRPRRGARAPVRRPRRGPAPQRVRRGILAGRGARRDVRGRRVAPRLGAAGRRRGRAHGPRRQAVLPVLQRRRLAPRGVVRRRLGVGLDVAAGGPRRRGARPRGPRPHARGARGLPPRGGVACAP